MMDKWQAIHALWSRFGLPAYDALTVPEDAVAPYITYDAAVGAFEDVIELTASVWYHSSSWAEISQKVEEIAKAVNPYLILPVDGGYMYVVKGSPFAQRLADEDDRMKRVYIVLQAEFFTNY